ncbi:MAG: SgcJ/EcaC family oxidoreductase [Solirubrobacteraceae bacterium]
MSNAKSPLAVVDLRAIEDLVAAAQAAQSDPETLLPLHTPEVVIVNIAGRCVVGRDAFADAMAGALASPLRDVRTTVTIDDVRTATPDVAIVSATKTVHDERTTADATAVLPTVGRLTYLVVRQADGWRIALAQTTPIVNPGPVVD